MNEIEPENEDGAKEDKGWPFVIPHPNTWHPKLKATISVFGLLICIVLLIGAIYLLVDILNLYFTPEIENRFSDLRTSLFILAALIGAPFLVWRTLLASQQTKIADAQAETARDRAYTELFTKAIEQLGAEKPAKKEITDSNGDTTTLDTHLPNIEVRIGAIFALERIMHDSEKDAPAIVDTLAAYIRENCGKPQEFVCVIPEEKDYKTIGEWLDAIERYVGERHKPSEGTVIDRAHKLRDQAPANRSDVQTALIVLGRRPDALKNKDSMPNLRGVNFQGADLGDFSFEYCNLSNANMQGANLTNANLQGTNLNEAKMQGAVLWGADMQGTKLRQARMERADLWMAKMQEVYLWRAEMQGTELRRTNIQRASLFSANMQGASLSQAKMQEADLGHVGMQGVDLSHAEMQSVDLSYAKLQFTDITQPQKTAASVIFVDFTKSINNKDILQSQLEEMFGHKTETTLPDDIAAPEHWSNADMGTKDGQQQYDQEWQAFKTKWVSNNCP